MFFLFSFNQYNFPSYAPYCWCNHANFPNGGLIKNSILFYSMILLLLVICMKNKKTYRHCFGIQLSEEEVASFKVIVEIEDGTAGRQVEGLTSVHLISQIHSNTNTTNIWSKYVCRQPMSRVRVRVLLCKLQEFITINKRSRARHSHVQWSSQ